MGQNVVKFLGALRMPGKHPQEAQHAQDAQDAQHAQHGVASRSSESLPHHKTGGSRTIHIRCSITGAYNYRLTFLTKNVGIGPDPAEIVYLPWDNMLWGNKDLFHPTLWACRYRSDAQFGQGDKLTQRFATHENYIYANYVFICSSILKTMPSVKKLIIVQDPSPPHKGQWWRDNVHLLKNRMSKLSAVLYPDGFVVSAVGEGARYAWKMPQITFMNTSDFEIMCGGVDVVRLNNRGPHT